LCPMQITDIHEEGAVVMQAVTMDTKIRMPTCLASWSIKQALGSFFTRVVKIKSWLSSRDCPLSTDPTTEHPTRLILAPPPTHWTDQDRTLDMRSDATVKFVAYRLTVFTVHPKR